MIRWFLRRQIRAFERTFDYDASYTRDILDASPRALFLFSWVSKIVGYREDVPADAWFAANITAAVAEDCGPCTQLAVTMAERSGVSPEAIRAVLAADEKAMSPDVALGFWFARAVLARDIDESDRLRAEILKRWGPRGLARFHHLCLARVSHGEVCSGPWPRVHPSARCRRRRPARPSRLARLTSTALFIRAEILDARRMWASWASTSISSLVTSVAAWRTKATGIDHVLSGRSRQKGGDPRARVRGLRSTLGSSITS